MNWDQIKGSVEQYTGKAREKWGRAHRRRSGARRGSRDQLVGVVQERYGIAREEAEKQVRFLEQRTRLTMAFASGGQSLYAGINSRNTKAADE